jgi:hypothetical protein
MMQPKCKQIRADVEGRCLQYERVEGTGRVEGSDVIPRELVRMKGL